MNYKKKEFVDRVINFVSEGSPVKVKKGRKRELETIFYFLPENFDGVDHTPDSEFKECLLTSDIPVVDSLKNYFDEIETGNSSKNVSSVIKSNLLYQAQRWRGIHMTMYMEGVLDGSMPYSVILSDCPEVVAKYLAGNLFCGANKELIMTVWEEENGKSEV